MKNSSNKFRGKNNKEYKKNSDFGYYSKNTNRSEKNDRFLNNSAKQKNVENLKKDDENNTFSSLKRRNPRFKSNFYFTPKPNSGSQNPKHQGVVCYGKDLRKTERLSKIEIKWLIDAYNQYPEKSKFFKSGFSLLSGTKSLEQQIKNNWSEKEIRKSWEIGLKKFKKLRKKYLLYP